jgi:hypothetical protein
MRFAALGQNTFEIIKLRCAAPLASFSTHIARLGSLQHHCECSFHKHLFLQARQKPSLDGEEHNEKYAN